MPIVCKSVAKGQDWRGGDTVCWTQSRFGVSQSWHGSTDARARRDFIPLCPGYRSVSWRLRGVRRNPLLYSFFPLATSRRSLQRIFCICRLQAKNGCMRRGIVARGKKLLMQLRKIFLAFAFNREPWRRVDGCANCLSSVGRFRRVNRSLSTSCSGKL